MLCDTVSPGIAPMETDANAPTYDLRAHPAWVDTLVVLADEFMTEGQRLCGPLVSAYRSWRNAPVCQSEDWETMLEALTCGVLWNCYSAKLLAVDDIQSVMAGLKGQILAAFDRFTSQLERCGDFETEARRIRRFVPFFAAAGEMDARGYVTAMSLFARWFQGRAHELLGVVTRQVDDFRITAAAGVLYRDDAALRNRREVEYHLNLLTVIVLNRAWRDRYEGVEKKLLVLPGCMRPDGGARCQGMSTDLGISCTGCTDTCAVNRTRRIAQRYGVYTAVLEHQSAVFAREQARAIHKEGYAVIGVACALSLQAGGWKAREAGIAAQCLPLQYAGCARHWSDGKGLPTDIDRKLLTGIISGTSFG